MGDGGCVSMDVNGRWKDVECDMLLSGAICYKPPPSESILSVFGFILSIVNS